MDHTDKISADMVLAYLHEWMGQEDGDEEVAAFALSMAQMVGEGKTYRDAGTAGYADFVEWVGERSQPKQKVSETAAAFDTAVGRFVDAYPPFSDSYRRAAMLRLAAHSLLTAEQALLRKLIVEAMAS